VAAWLFTLDRVTYLPQCSRPSASSRWRRPEPPPERSRARQNLLSDYPVLYNFHAQYQSFVLPFSWSAR